jgi:hypothetical protein
MGRRLPDENFTLRVDPDVVLWARMRALRSGTTVSRVIRAFLEEYAAVPRGWWEGWPAPWDVDPNAPDEALQAGVAPPQG